jgi:pimeloyl-ACP methyl ester carboxylesterase
MERLPTSSMRVPALALALSVAAGAAFAQDSQTGPADGDRESPGRPPLVLQTQGVFWAGGRIVNRTQPGLENERILVDQAYVEYFIPKDLRYGRRTPPIILTHSTVSGVVWRPTGDGREGWTEFFVRQGFPVYVIDPPGVGRAGFDIDQVNQAATGQIPPLSANPLGHGDSQAWP